MVYLRPVSTTSRVIRSSASTLHRAAESTFRALLLANPILGQIMFARPFADFDPTKDEARVGVKVRKLFVRYIRDAIDADQLSGDPTDLALVLFTYIEAIAAADNAQRLGGSKQSAIRRYRLGLDAFLAGRQ
jgi:hypothetical protein